MASSATEARYPELHRASFEYPAIDNHAHPLLLSESRSKIPFEGMVSEAQDDALDDAIHTLACYRATAQLGRLFNLPPPANDSEITWDQVKAHRDTLEYDELCRTCFLPTRIQCILIDDGLNDVEDLAVTYPWHDRFTRSPTKRIVRIEKLAEDILKLFFDDGFGMAHLAFPTRFIRSFWAELLRLGKSDDIVAFKSIICYRTGLDVSVPATDPTSGRGIDDDIAEIEQTYESQGTVRVQHKFLNDYLVRTALSIAAEVNKPVQFHTGLGDNDISLTKSSPAHLQPIIKAFPNTKFVLLHASYPFTREAAYLSSVYKNVFLDVGEIFPMVSGDGQREIVRQVLELCPINKMMWSTDGHWWPESYYLGAIQGRQALYEVLAQSVDRQEITERQAVTIVQNALFHNANALYNLKLGIAD